MKQQDWTEQLRQRLDEHEVPAPKGLWADIERRTEQTAVPPRHARMVLLRRWVVGIAACALVAVGMREVMRQLPPPALPQNDKAETAMLDDKIAIEHFDKPSTQSASPSAQVGTAGVSSPSAQGRTASVSTPSTKGRTASVSTLSAKGGTVGVSTPSTGAEPESADRPSTKAATHETAEKPSADPTTATASTTHDTPSSPTSHRTLAPVGKSTSPRRHLELAVHAANLMAYGGTSQSEPLLMAPSYMGPKSHALSCTAPVYLAGYEDLADHKMPVTVGLSLRLPLTGRLWMAGGVDYSMLSSTFTHRMGISTQRIGQRLHYVGVSLAAGHSFWQTPHLTAYISGGAEAQLNVKTHVDEGRLNRDRVQFSMLGSAGLEYTPLPRLGICLQPGLRFYPDNGSHIQNIYKERPLQFDLQLGLRYTLK